MLRRLLRFGAVALTLTAVTAHAQQVPVQNQAVLLLRILAYDRALADRAGHQITVAIVAREAVPESQVLQSDLMLALREVAQRTTVAGKPVRVIQIDYSDPGKFENAMTAERVDALYLSSGLAADLEAIVGVSRKHKALTFTGVRTYVDGGVSFALVRRGTRPAILVNLVGVRSEGANLDAALLRVAEVVNR